MRILLVTSRFPFPARRGNQARTAEWLEALAGHERALVAPEAGDPAARRALDDLGVNHFAYRLGALARGGGLVAAALRGWPLQEGLYTGRAACRALVQAVACGRWDVAVVQMQRCGWAAGVIRRLAPGTPILFDAIDAMGLHYARTEVLFAPPLRPAVRLEAALCRRRERWLAGLAAVTTAVSRVDLEFLEPAGVGRVVPVSGREIARRDASPAVATVLLSGNLGYRPTVAGALAFASTVWPPLRARLPGARWVLAGARPPRAVRRLAALDGVEVRADVPDLGPFLAGASVAIAPMRTGSGVPIKVLEAWAAGVPVVATPAAAEGLEVLPAPGVALAERPAEWVEALVRYATDPAAAADLTARGRAVWERYYSPERVGEAVRAAVEEAASTR